MPFQPIHHYYYSAGDWLWSIFSTLLFLALIAAAVTLLVRVFAGPRRAGYGRVGAAVRGGGIPGPWYGPGAGGGRPFDPTGAGTEPGPEWESAGGAERILAERYARGEIAEDEVRSRLEVLRQTAAAGAGWSYAGPQPQPSPGPSRQSQPQPSPQPAFEAPPEPPSRPQDQPRP